MAIRIREWKPWTKSTGPVTAKGKRKSSKNARRSARARFMNKLRRFVSSPSELHGVEVASQTQKAVEIQGLGVESNGFQAASELDATAQSGVQEQNQPDQGDILNPIPTDKPSELQAYRKFIAGL